MVYSYCAIKFCIFVNNAVNVYEKSSNSGMKLNKNYPRLRDTVQQLFNHHEVDSKALVVYFRAEQWKICVEEFCSYVVSCNSRLCMVDKVETCDGRLYPGGSCNRLAAPTMFNPNRCYKNSSVQG